MDCTLATIDNGIKHTLGLEGTKDTVPLFHSFVLFHSIHSFSVSFIHFLPKQMETFYLLKNVASFLRPSEKDAAFLSLPVDITYFFFCIISILLFSYGYIINIVFSNYVLQLSGAIVWGHFSQKLFSKKSLMLNNNFLIGKNHFLFVFKLTT